MKKVICMLVCGIIFSVSGADFNSLLKEAKAAEKIKNTELANQKYSEAYQAAVKTSDKESHHAIVCLRPLLFCVVLSLLLVLMIGIGIAPTRASFGFVIVYHINFISLSSLEKRHQQGTCDHQAKPKEGFFRKLFLEYEIRKRNG